MSDGPYLLERVQMCLAEVGVDPGGVWWDGEAICWDEDRPDVFARPVWAAEQVCGLPFVCWACEQTRWSLRGDAYAAVGDRCLAFLPLTEDCGVDR